MAGVKGRSGGARPNSGPKPKPPVFAPAQADQDPLDFMLSVQNDSSLPVDLRLKAAVAAAQYVHTKTHDGGKKEAKAKEAAKAGQGRFEPSGSPLKRVA